MHDVFSTRSSCLVLDVPVLGKGRQSASVSTRVARPNCRDLQEYARFANHAIVITIFTLLEMTPRPN
jgi:hypothetical protein